ncbi:hypothetical protein [Ramlibacter algicola]|uniref:Uncharacterized protein n=1 Tax=Ramlibacter algicola TaxID=2795217 RepID=A0A934Q064_9BURK|nr:hypothetical protein [Ramlibacter algicola]MBK0392638.1 hypothetical protein [Ramlibacter algicola]
MPPPTPPPKKKTALDDPYQYGDTIPAPEAEERNTDTAWALFTELSEKQERKFQPTTTGSVPADLPTDLGAPAGFETTAPTALGEAAAGAAAAAGDLEALMQEARRNNRVCPHLAAWQALYDMLPGKQQVNGQWQPPLPIPPQAWRVTSAMVKRLCLRDHLEWAASHGAAQQVLAFLKSLPEEHWLHME